MGVASVGMVGFLVWNLFGKKTNQNGDIGIDIQAPVEVVPMERAARISWQISGDNLPKTANIYIGETGNGENLDRLLSEVGLSRSEVISDDPQTIFLGNSATRKNVYMSKSNGKIGFSLDIYSSEDIPKGNLLNETEAEEKLVDLIKRIENNDKLGIKINSIKYKKVLFPRWVESTKSEADAVEISASWTIEGIEVKTFYDSPILAVFGRGGTIIKLEYVPLAKVNEKKEVNLLSLTEIQTLSEDNFGIWKKEGNTSYSLSEDKEIVGQIVVRSIELIYVQGDRSEKIWPYYLIEGNSISKNNGPIKVYLMVRATK